ncbi:MAG TPA: hypothetical protein VKQ30_16035 [Ktedonobacterales bacterium]|nr:hypothetical protein [Ktedonobacterales bacterium]
MPATCLTVLLSAAGIFTAVLGTLHFLLPTLLDYRTMLLDRPADWKTPRPFRVWLTHYVVNAQDRYGIVWIMNHAASYTLVSIGLLDLLGAQWLQSDTGRPFALWIAGWWFLRAVAQLYLGRRIGDMLILVFFAALGLLHLAIWLA